MNKIELKNKQILINNKPFFILSGEIHYFRIPKNLWKKHLSKAKKTGLNTVSTYIPWMWHEFEEGKFDFSGQTLPERDLLTFINLVKENDLFLIARVGPVSNAELLNEGIPNWLIKNYPDICLKGKGLPNLPHITLLSYHNTIFQKFVRRWYENVLKILRNEQITENGNILLVQLCNEIGMVHWVNKVADYGIYAENLYRKYLEKKYKEINKLNEIYLTNFKDFSEINQPENKLDFFEENKWVQYTDWMMFYSEFYALYFKFLYDNYIDNKMNLPVIANIPQFYDFDVRGRGVYSPMTTIMFNEFKKYVPEIIFGGAYQMRELDWENFHDIPITTEVVKMISKEENPSICCELQTGILRDRPRIYPQDVELNLKNSTAHDLNGLNCYMFSSGRNLKDMGVFSSYHDWQAPVGLNLEEKEHLLPIKTFGEFIRTFGAELSTMRKVVDTTIGFYPHYYLTELLTGKYIEELEIKRNLLFFDGIARLLQINNINFNMINLLEVDYIDSQKIPSLWFVSFGKIDEETQKKLYDYILNGGSLFIGPDVPNEFLRRFKIDSNGYLKDNIVYFYDEDIFVYDKIQVFETRNCNCKIFAKTKTGSCCGMEINVSKGKLVVAGFGITHIFDYHIDVINKIAKLLSINPSIQITPEKQIVATIRKNEESGFVFLSNFQKTVKDCKISLVLPKEKNFIKIPNKGTIKFASTSAKILPLYVSLNNNIIIRYSTVEILSYKNIKNKIIIKVFSSTIYNAEMEFIYIKKPKIVKVDNKKVNIYWSKNKFRVNFLTNSNTQIVEVA